MSRVDETKFEGVYVAMTSCYDEEGNVDADRAAQLTRYLIRSGVQGIYVGGSSGEGVLQSTAERQTILEAVVRENDGAVQIIAHIGAATTRDSVELAVHAEQSGVDAISSIPPYYYKISESGVKRHWLALLEAAALPFIIYNVPATTGFALSIPLFKEMVQYERVVGVKNTTLSTYELQQFKRWGGERFAVFNGPDEQYLAGRVMGACGGIGGTYGVMPEIYVKLEQCIREGRIAEAGLWQARVNDIITGLHRLPTRAAIKEIIRRRGVDTGRPRLPLEPLGEEHIPAVERLTETILQYVAQCG